MSPTIEEREKLFKAFARALFTRDMEALYQTVAPDFVWDYHDGVATTKCLRDHAAVLKHLEEQKELFSHQRFFDVAYHHLAEATFMTFRVSETVRATGEAREQRGVERYSFSNGLISVKDVYRKPL